MAPVSDDQTAPRRLTRRELHAPERQESALLAFGPLLARLQTAAGVLAVLALAAIVVDGLRNGLSFAIMGRWIGVYVAAMLVASAVAVAVHALGGAGRAQRRGERLSSPDVGLAPRRRR